MKSPHFSQNQQKIKKKILKTLILSLRQDFFIFWWFCEKCGDFTNFFRTSLQILDHCTVPSANQVKVFWLLWKACPRTALPAFARTRNGTKIQTNSLHNNVLLKDIGIRYAFVALLSWLMNRPQKKKIVFT